MDLFQIIKEMKESK